MINQEELMDELEFELTNDKVLEEAEWPVDGKQFKKYR